MATRSKTPRNKPIRIGDVTVQPGKRENVSLPIAKLYTATSLHMPVKVLCGRKPGPVLFLSAAIHGDELNGVEIIRRLLRHRALRSLRGSLLAVPIVNVHGFIEQSRYLPDRRDRLAVLPRRQRVFGNVVDLHVGRFDIFEIAHADGERVAADLRQPDRRMVRPSPRRRRATAPGC
mgnify:CR=1 FL=1